MSQSGNYFNSLSPLPGRPTFSAKVGSTVQNVTGDGTVYTIVFDTEIFDIGNNFDTTTGIFTAPITGKYLFICSIDIRSLAAFNTEGDITFVTSNRPYFVSRSNYGVMRDPTANLLIQNLSIEADMDSGDTAQVDIVVRGGGLVIDIFGQGGTEMHSFFQGWYLG